VAKVSLDLAFEGERTELAVGMDELRHRCGSAPQSRVVGEGVSGAGRGVGGFECYCDLPDSFHDRLKQLLKGRRREVYSSSSQSHCSMFVEPVVADSLRTGNRFFCSM